MTTFVTPIAPSTAMTRVTPSAPVPDLRFKNDQLMWIGVPAATTIAAFATGSVARSYGTGNGIPGNSGSDWTLFQLSPLPQMDPASFKLISGGLPVQLVLVPGAAGATPATDDCLVAGATLTTAASGAFLAIAFQDRLCRDPLTWAEAIAASGVCDANWPLLIAALAALPNARNLRVLDARGFPLVSGTVGVAIGAGAPTSVVLNAAMDGDTGIAVGSAAQATVTFTSAAHPVVASGDADTGAGFDDGHGGVAGNLQLAPGKRMAQVLDADQWMAAPDAPIAATRRWYANSFLEPIQEGTPYFTRLVGDMRAAKPGGKVEMAGWAFVKGSQSDATVDWPLIPGDSTTTLLNLINELRGSTVEVRMLINQFLRFDSSTLDDFPELGAILFALYASLSPLQALLSLQTDPAGYVVGLIAVVAIEAEISSGDLLTRIKSFAEYSKPLVDALGAIDPTIATWTPYDAAFADNPLISQPPKILGHTIDDISHLGVYHQKYVVIQIPSSPNPSYVGYLGGIDINNDRPDTTIHRALHPFHDVQVRITGPAVTDLVQSYDDRATHHAAPVAIPAATLGSIPAAGSHLVQIARTYFKPGAVSSTPALSFASKGESTPIRTIKQAISQARDFIYIEDQYFTPPDDYVQALVSAASSGVQALMITMPYETDQPYGEIRRQDVLSQLQTAWGSRFYTGTPLRRFLHERPALTTNLGRMRLANLMTAGASQCDVSPLSHIPPAPFWAFLGNELVLFAAPMGAPTGTGSTAYQTMEIVRAFASPGWGATPVDHAVGTPVLAVQVPGIYVHAKVMIVDDIFLFVGSSNVNRRGFYHDGEMNSFTVPQHLKGDPANPARLLRARLMAEHMGLSPEMGQSLFADPVSAVQYFTSRSWYQGAHRQPLGFFGSLPPDIPLATSDSLGSWILTNLVPAAEVAAKPDVWPLLVDPTTSLDASSKKGPEYP
jgi:phosphatidylserine/phosphatidylglycerophosphate/cardiolipin synthase-like enzyme